MRCSNGQAAIIDLMKEQLERQGVESRSSSPSDFLAFMEAELVKWFRVVKDSGERAD